MVGKGKQMRSLTAALATAALALPFLAWSASAKMEPIACTSRSALYKMLNAANRHDRLEMTQKEGAACQPLRGTHYELVEAKNGVSEIRIFPREGDWTDSRIAYTLDEMLGQ